MRRLVLVLTMALGAGACDSPNAAFRDGESDAGTGGAPSATGGTGGGPIKGGPPVGGEMAGTGGAAPTGGTGGAAPGTGGAAPGTGGAGGMTGSRWVLWTGAALDWAGAVAACQGMGAVIAQPRGAAENMQVMEAVAAQGGAGTPQIWLGFLPADAAGIGVDWRYLNAEGNAGNPIGWTNWRVQPTEAPAGSKAQRAAMTLQVGGGGFLPGDWGIVRIGGTNGFVCQRW